MDLMGAAMATLEGFYDDWMRGGDVKMLEWSVEDLRQPSSRKSFWREVVALLLCPHHGGSGVGQRPWIATRLLQRPQTLPSGSQLRSGCVPSKKD